MRSRTRAPPAPFTTSPPGIDRVGPVEGQVQGGPQPPDGDAQLAGEGRAGARGGVAGAAQAARHPLAEGADAGGGGAPGARARRACRPPRGPRPRGRRPPTRECARRSSPARLCDDRAVHEVAPGIHLIDTLLGGTSRGDGGVPGDGRAARARRPGRAHLRAGRARGARGARTGPADLAWIVPTHVHLDHCGATGILAAAFPDGDRGRAPARRAPPERARRACWPARRPSTGGAGRSTAASIRTPAGRIAAVEDGHRDRPGRRARPRGDRDPRARAPPHLRRSTPPPARSIAGDAVGVRVRRRRASTRPCRRPTSTWPPGVRSLDRLAGLAPEHLLLAHFGPVARPGGDASTWRGVSWRLMGEAGRAAAGPADARRRDRAPPAAGGDGGRPGGGRRSGAGSGGPRPTSTASPAGRRPTAATL